MAGLEEDGPWPGGFKPEIGSPNAGDCSAHAPTWFPVGAILNMTFFYPC